MRGRCRRRDRRPAIRSGRNGAGDRPKACLCSGFCLVFRPDCWQCQIGMVEDVEELRVQPEGNPLVMGMRFVTYTSEYVKCGPLKLLRPELPNWQFVGESPPAQAPVLGSTNRSKGIRVQPLSGARWCYARDRSLQ